MGRHKVATGCLGALALLFACGLILGVVGTLGAIGSSSGSSGTLTTATATVPRRATATPKGTNSAVYAALVAADLAPLSHDANTIGTDCGAQDLAACRADAVQFQTDSSLIQRAGTEMQAATSEMSAANSSMQTVHC